MGETRVVKRYANRKLYDTQRSRYVTLEQIADMIRSGEDVKIVDNNSKDDLTSVTLAQIIFEEEKKQKSFLPLTAMRNIIQQGGDAIQEAGARMRNVFRRDGKPEDPPSPPAETVSPLKELVETSQKTFDEWQKKVDERVRTTFEALNPMAAIEKELKALQQRLEQLEKRLESND